LTAAVTACARLGVLLREQALGSMHNVKERTTPGMTVAVLGEPS